MRSPLVSDGSPITFAVDAGDRPIRALMTAIQEEMVGGLHRRSALGSVDQDGSPWHRGKISRGALVIACASLLLSSHVATSGTPPAERVTLESLLARAGLYLTEFVNQFANVVTEERYLQDVDTAQLGFGEASGGRGNTTGDRAAHREIKSDFLLVTSGQAAELRPFRDVYEVDGRPVRDRQDRLTKLFLEPSATTFEQAAAIANESARYNLGNMTRTMNNPVVALGFLQADYQKRFRLSLGKPDPGAGSHTWTVEYREESRPTLIRGAFDRDLPAHGRFWIDAVTGHILRTELRLEDTTVRARIMTSFRPDERLHIEVPFELREEYALRTGGHLSGVATYGRFRRFDVSTAETIQPAVPR
jgi:hypothetical protein